MAIRRPPGKAASSADIALGDPGAAKRGKSNGHGTTPVAKKKAPLRTAKATGGLTSSAPASRTADHHATQHAVEQFLYAQAELLDNKRWREYIDLFTEDGHYWMPAAPEQTTGEGVPSIFYEDRNLMNVRMRRIQHPDAWSQRPLWGTNHVVGNVIVETENPATGELVVRSRFHMMEFRRESSRHFGGSYVHHLVRTAAGLRIRLQRVDLVNGQGPFEYVLQIWV